jgi:hypothetical protein
MLIGHGGGALFNHTFIQHEFGHVMGLPEAWSTTPDQAYGDDFCIMAAFTTPYEFQTTILQETNQAGPGMNSAYLGKLDGFAPGQVLELPTDASATARRGGDSPPTKWPTRDNRDYRVWVGETLKIPAVCGCRVSLTLPWQLC